MNPEVTLRPVGPEDQDLLFRVYASTRTEELELTDWNAEQKRAFLQMQFAAQHEHYQKHYPDAQFSVIVKENVPIGRLYLDRWEREIRVVDIALLPEHRGTGIGTTLLTAILKEGEAAGKSVTIHVEQFNPALRLYERLGFQKRNPVGIYYLMEFLAPGSVSEWAF